MGSLERSKKRVQLWKKAMVHFSLCFVMGFFTGFAPTGKSSISSTQAASVSNRTELAPQPTAMSQTTNVNRSLIAPTLEERPTSPRVPKQDTKLHDAEGDPNFEPRRHIIIVTPTSTKIPFGTVFLRRLANTIKLVPQPLLWIVVEPPTEFTEVSEILRKTGIMYRHLVSKENFTDLEAELNHQRNLALKHIEHHRLSGIVHFADLSNAYDLEFFHQLRDIEYEIYSYFSILTSTLIVVMLIFTLNFWWETGSPFSPFRNCVLRVIFKLKMEHVVGGRLKKNKSAN